VPTRRHSDGAPPYPAFVTICQKMQAIAAQLMAKQIVRPKGTPAV
jgi:hypothetical protein